MIMCSTQRANSECASASSKQVATVPSTTTTAATTRMMDMRTVIWFARLGIFKERTNRTNIYQRDCLYGTSMKRTPPSSFVLFSFHFFFLNCHYCFWSLHNYYLCFINLKNIRKMCSRGPKHQSRFRNAMIIELNGEPSANIDQRKCLLFSPSHVR